MKTRRGRKQKTGRGGSIDPFVNRHFPSFLLPPSVHVQTSIKPSPPVAEKGKKEEERKEEGVNSSEWAESRRRPESYVSRIWKGPSFLPGIIENRCRLSLYADQHSLTTRGKELSSLPSPPLLPLLGHRRFHHRETDSSRPLLLHPSYCYSVTAKTTGSTFHVPSPPLFFPFIPRTMVDDGSSPIDTNAVVKETLNPLVGETYDEIGNSWMHSHARIIHAGSASILYLLLLPSSTSLLLSLLLACASRDIVLERFAASSSSSSSYSSRGEIISLIFLGFLSFFVVYIPANNVQQ